jgi:hypothetical protein
MGDPAGHVPLAEVPDGWWQAAPAEAAGGFRVTVRDHAGPLSQGINFPSLQGVCPDEPGRFPTDADDAGARRARHLRPLATIRKRD